MASGYPSSFLHESLAGCARACYFVAEDSVEPPSDARPPGTPRNSTEIEATPGSERTGRRRGSSSQPSLRTWLMKMSLNPGNTGILLFCVVPVRRGLLYSKKYPTSVGLLAKEADWVLCSGVWVPA